MWKFMDAFIRVICYETQFANERTCLYLIEAPTNIKAAINEKEKKKPKEGNCISFSVTSKIKS